MNMWDYAIIELERAHTFAQKMHYKKGIPTLPHSLKSEQQWHTRDAIERACNHIIDLNNGKWRNNKCAIHDLCRDFKISIEQNADRFDDETKQFAGDICNKLFSLCNYREPPYHFELANEEEVFDEDPNFSGLFDIDNMDGSQFEIWCSKILRANGFQDVSLTGGSGDQGVDILATKDNIKYAIQCKCYSSPLGNTPIQEVESGRVFYGCHVGAVMTNQTFTKGARQLAEKTNTILWDRKTIEEMSGAAEQA